MGDKQRELIDAIAKTEVKAVSVVEISNGFIVSVGKHQFSVDNLYGVSQMLRSLFDQENEWHFGRKPKAEPEPTIDELEAVQEKIDNDDIAEVEGGVDQNVEVPAKEVKDEAAAILDQAEEALIASEQETNGEEAAV